MPIPHLRTRTLPRRYSTLGRTRETFRTKLELVRDTSTHWGTAWATIGLLHTPPKPEANGR